MASPTLADQEMPAMAGLTHITVTSKIVAEYYTHGKFVQVAPDDPMYSRVAHVKFRATAPELIRRLKVAGWWTPELWAAELSVRRVLWEAGLELGFELEEDIKQHGCRRLRHLQTTCEVIPSYATDGVECTTSLWIIVPLARRKEWTSHIGSALTNAAWTPDLDGR